MKKGRRLTWYELGSHQWSWPELWDRRRRSRSASCGEDFEKTPRWSRSSPRSLGHTEFYGVRSRRRRWASSFQDQTLKKEQMQIVDCVLKYRLYTHSMQDNITSYITCQEVAVTGMQDAGWRAQLMQIPAGVPDPLSRNRRNPEHPSPTSWWPQRRPWGGRKTVGCPQHPPSGLSSLLFQNTETTNRAEV